LKIPLVALVFVTLASVSHSTAAEPYDLRGIRLGMSLNEFRAIPFPDAHETNYNIKVICTNDPEARLMFDLWVSSDDESLAGVVYCNFFGFRTLYAGVPPEWEEERLNVATIGSYMMFKFVPSPDTLGDYNLYLITARTNVDNWDKYWRGYTGKYGPPKITSDEPIQNNAGATFDNITAIWDNGESTITLIKRFDRIDNTYAIYSHTKLSSLIDKLVEQQTGAPSDNL